MTTNPLRSSPLRFLSERSDLILAAMLVGVVAMMIIPLPTQLLDILLTVNITLAVIILLVSIYVPNALMFASFPSILLITTLYRLGLNISSTRLILLNGYAGEVINAFGDFVVAGNYVVGGVVFLILVVIQFIVISKGSERVAEVAARFTLDAMPGKQMSIDAEARSGQLSQEEARRRRGMLEMESRLYGSMDGAMKFVKGDAIAGIIITLINIVGGLIIGVAQRGMSAGDAAQVYSLLTIGDGLVSQIPALLISTSAGMVVTRVASEEGPSNLGKDISSQLLSQPKAIAIAAVILIGLGLVPGLPFVPFLLLASVSGFVGWTLLKQDGESAEQGEEEEEPVADLSAADSPFPQPITILIGPDLEERLGRRIDTEKPGFRRTVEGCCRQTLGELGVPLLASPVVQTEESLAEGQYVLCIYGVPYVQARVEPGSVLVESAPDQLQALLGVDAEPAEHPVTGAVVAWIPESSADQARHLNAPVHDATGCIELQLRALLRGQAGEFVGLEEVQKMLEMAGASFPTLIEQLKPVRLTTVTEVFRRLVQEQIPLRDMRTILQVLVDKHAKETDPIMLTEYVRQGLRRQLAFQYTGGLNNLSAYIVDPEIENAVRSAIHHSSGGSYLRLEPDVQSAILEAIRREVGQPLEGAQTSPVVLTRAEIRRYLRSLIQTEFPRLAVLSYSELTPEMNVNPIARIAMPSIDEYAMSGQYDAAS